MSKPLILELKEKMDKIIEKGSNDNGTYIKFSDGTLIQYGSTNGIDNNYKTVNFPIAFYKKEPVVSVNTTVADINYIHLAQSFDVTLSNFKAYVRYQPVSGGSWGTGANWFNWFAIGNWK